MMKRMTREEIKQVQKDVLDALVRFCNEQSIRVSVSSGTLIGVVRHKGYIPWDDDIDVYMPREDYIRFEQKFPDIFEEKYRLASMYRNPKWHLTFAKLYDTRTITELESRSTEPYGVFVDIFPIDDVPEDEKAFKSYMCKLGWMRFYLNDVRRITPEMSLLKKMVIGIHHFCLSLFSHQFLMRVRDNYCQKFNGKGFTLGYANSYGPLQPHPFPKSFFNDIILWDFEDRQVPGFREADTFLKLQYGDYMQIPPEDKRKPHSEIAYWKNN